MATPQVVRILGFDPGSRRTGFGVIERSAGGRLTYVASGSIVLGALAFNDRLRRLYSTASALVREQAPDEISIERVFMHRNADSALKLGHARAALICATFADDVPVFEYAAREVKQTVTGSGAAAKSQVAHMVCRLLGVQGDLGADAADALAIAICHAHCRSRPKLDATAERS
jgi:crossover junction endodeoxyribonuclease RuvC